METKKNISNIAYEYIEKKILSNEWTSGMKISSENKMVTELGISRVSVREAIEKLVTLNVLTKKKGGGTFVNDLSPSMYLNGLLSMILIDSDNLLDILVFRKIIETESAELCAENCDQDLLTELEQCYENMKKFIDDKEKFYFNDFKFHYCIAKGTHNSMIIKINTILTDLLKHHQKELNLHLGSHSGIIDHEKILDAIKNRDPEMAGLFMKRHLTRTINEIKQITTKI
ncbi:MAG: FadR family transcriptional regulator [Spirochaetaceae bacterium]